MSEPREVVGAVALYGSADSLVAGLARVREKGFRRLDTVSPYPIHGIDHLLGKEPSRLGYVALGAGLVGAGVAKLIQWFISSVDYPLNIGGKPLFSWPAFVPVTFELMVLFAAVATVVAMLALFNRLPQYGNSLLSSRAIREVTCDKFGIVVDARDAAFEVDGIEQALGGPDVLDVELLYRVPPSRFFSEQIFSVRFLVLLVALAAASAAGTRMAWKYGGALPPFDFMKAQQKLNPQQASAVFDDGLGMRPPVAGTVPRGMMPYAYAEDPDGAALDLVNPIRPTEAALETGRDRFDTFCLPCHGVRGDGKGTLTAAFPRAPSLHSSKVRAWSDGRVYHVLTVGQNVMPAYPSQIGPEDRWRIIHYLRALQRSANAPERDLP